MDTDSKPTPTEVELRRYIEKLETELLEARRQLRDLRMERKHGVKVNDPRRVEKF